MAIIDIISYMYYNFTLGIETELFLFFTNSLFFSKILQKRYTEKNSDNISNYYHYLIGFFQSFLLIVSSRHMLYGFRYFTVYITYGLLDHQDIMLLCKACYFVLLFLINYLIIMYNVGFKQAVEELFGNFDVFRVCYQGAIINFF